MLTCPQCGHQAPDGEKFCDRCGQGLSASPIADPSPALAPLEPGTKLRSGFEITLLLSQNSQENRYRVSRDEGGKTLTYQLRERLGPRPDETRPEGENMPAPAANGETSGATQSIADDPNGPNAKTADLQPIAANAEARTPAVPASAATEPLSEEPGDEEVLLTDELAVGDTQGVAARETGETGESGAEAVSDGDQSAQAESPAPKPEPEAPDDLGEVFGRVLALSMTLKHPAFQCAREGFAHDGRVYLVYPDESLKPLSRRPGGIRMGEGEALALAIQLCQAVSFLHRRALRLNDICPESIALGADGRLRITGLDCVSNDNELQAEPILNDGYTAPEIYRAKQVDKRADIFSVGAVIYTCLTGERIESESWRGEAGPITFYPPHVISPALEQALRRALLFNPEVRWPNIDALKAELVRMAGAIRLRSGVLTDVGMVRELNEDIVMAAEYLRDSQVEPAQSFLYLVCDGMGGAEAGEIAAAIAAATIRNYVRDRVNAVEGEDLDQLLRSALEEANSKIVEYQAAHPEARGMGSTAVGILAVPPRAAIAWVGDSRAYMLDRGSLRQLTKDHSLVQRLIEIGQITPDEARHHEHKNVITRSLGARPSGPAGAEAMTLRLKRGDRLMLCSDGLVAHVDDDSIGEVMRRHADPYEAVRELVVAANAGGGTDNVSVIVVFAD